jgi:hypothetical protein
MADTLTGFLDRAQNSGRIYAALYELTDTELVDALVALGKKLDIVVADIAAKPRRGAKITTAGNKTKTRTAAKKSADKKAADLAEPSDGDTLEENKGAWDRLHASANVSLYRLPPSSHIVHNKFLIYVDGKTSPKPFSPAQRTGPRPACARKRTIRW